MRAYANIHAIVTAPEFSNLQFIFITLTVKNCKADRLVDTLDLIAEGWGSLTSNKRQPIRKSFLGTFRAFEVTYDGDETVTKRRYKAAKGYCDRTGLKVGDRNPNCDTYHPHIHVLAAVDESYFAPDSPKRITRERLVELWRGASGAEYDPSVTLRR